MQTPYTDRTIARSNTWRWKRGRTVFELVAPGGDVYVMQSYAQIKDPTLTLAKLRSLGRRLKLPSGWRYRTRRLTRELVLSANGSATITGAVEQQQAAAREIARNVQQAAVGTKEVSSNIREVREAAEDTGASAHQVLASSQALSQQSEVLRGEVENYLRSVSAA